MLQELKHGIIESEFTNLGGRDWLEWNLEKSNGDWKLIFGLTCWMLWNWRNNCCFEEGFSMPKNRARIIGGYVENVKRAQLEFGRAATVPREVQIRWVAPPDGWVKVNIDGVSKGERRLAGCGGLIRGSQGEWLCGFTRKLGSCSAIKAEVWAVLSGMELAFHYKFDKIIVESDCTAVVSLLTDLQNVGTAKSMLLKHRGSFLRKFSNVVFSHVYREGNFCADSLANLSLVQEEYKAILLNPPQSVIRYLYRDCLGIVYPRVILI
ncbi:hypothetical protein QN277_021939 [Acacia crassicarpa]|uniref:RNase H type-1 domain-containing protein n=1 Tax=Acacia crassicarpa TaxID=499986 RepID=A0AAE1JN40_9FABA|nr:hypothetical protein QN277_021939 [Acacia crassicarpa]